MTRRWRERDSNFRSPLRETTLFPRELQVIQSIQQFDHPGFNDSRVDAIRSKCRTHATMNSSTGNASPKWLTSKFRLWGGTAPQRRDCERSTAGPLLGVAGFLAFQISRRPTASGRV